VSFERYHQAVDYLQQRLWHELPIVPIERALQHRIRHVFAHLCDPQTRFPVVHVGGSAGKGSTTTMVAAILQASGRRTGCYTSPHLQTFIERIAVDGALISPEAFADNVLGLDPLVRQMHTEVLDGVGYGRPALVEVAFAAGMKHFADEGCDAAAIEVGLGGRTDCTNVFDDKPVTVITHIEYEHTERLGATYAAIAREKSALIRGSEIVVTGAAHRDAIEVIEQRCATTDAMLWRLGRDVRVRVRDADACGTTIDVRTPAGNFANLRVPLAGAHQVHNAGLAVAAAAAFGARTGSSISEQHMRDGLAGTRLSGRLEVMQRHPIVVLDSAHNPFEASHLAKTLEQEWLAGGARLHLICGILADKDQPRMARALARIASSVVVTQPPLVERAGDPGRMIDAFRRDLGADRVTFEPAPAAALDRALTLAGSRDVVCVTGSMFLVGALRERWLPEDEILMRRSSVL
jgi:dihydrofolate synthase / folylpolyglutamate synthase